MEELEKAVLDAGGARAAAYAARASADAAEELGPAEAAVEAALGVLSRGGALPAAAAAATAAAERVEAKVRRLETFNLLVSVFVTLERGCQGSLTEPSVHLLWFWWGKWWCKCMDESHLHCHG